MKKLLLVLACGLMIFQSCKKYEDGPAFSLRSKAARLEGKWGLEKLLTNAKEEVLTADDLDDTWEFASDKKLTITDPGNSTDNGTWEFSSDKKYVVITDNASSLVIKLHILRLTNSEFWYDVQFGSDKTEYHLKSK